ncbi:hypothetical protein PTKIN_Ptkin19aG0071100 [Pterospermum kingtungense]
MVIFLDEDPRPMTAAVLAAVISRLKREESEDHQHDSHFSKWKVLIGPDDWKDYSVGKEGVSRYRIENLPQSSSSGIYELGIYRRGSSSRDNPRKLDPGDVLAVYLGEADNIRTRLQQYGRRGAHLGTSGCGEKGCGFFEDIFKRGYSIVYRWAPELDKCASNLTKLAILSRKHLPFLQKQVGIKIKASKLLSLDNEFSKYVDGERDNSLPQVFKFGRSQPRSVLDHSVFVENYTITCGVVLEDGSICRRPPVEGRKRCAEHKGKKTNEVSGFDMKSSELFPPKKLETRVSLERPVSSYGSDDIICGVELGDGYLCRKQPVRGRIRCEDHKGMKVTSLLSRLEAKTASHNQNNGSSSCSTSICGAPCCNGSSCQRKVEGNGRCFQHLNCDGNSTSNSNYSPNYSNYGNGSSTSICRALCQDGSSCKRKVEGNGRCFQHLNYGGNGTNNSNYGPYLNYGHSSSTSICGAPCRDGSSCQRKVEGNGRCFQHLNYGGNGTIISPHYLNYGGSSSKSICGAPCRDGSSCQRTVNGSGRCWQHLNYGGNISSNNNYSPHYSNYGYSSSTSICGAPCRNGSYCQRRVKGNGRCWQH